MMFLRATDTNQMLESQTLQQQENSYHFVFVYRSDLDEGRAISYSTDVYDLSEEKV